MIKYSEIVVHIVCATKNILKTPKNIRRYDFYSYLCIRKIIFARLLTYNSSLIFPVPKRPWQ